MLHTEFIPAAEKDSRALMVMLHGLGDSLEGYRWFPAALNLPWMNYLLVNAPDDYYGGYSWFDIDNKTPGVLRSRQLLFDLLDDLRAKNFPADQVTLGGFSQGCLMTIDVGLRYPHKLVGLVGISGWVFEIEKLLSDIRPALYSGQTAIYRLQRLLFTHGQFDTLIPITKVREQIEFLQKGAGINVAYHEFPKAHTIYGEEELAVIREFVRAGYAGK